MTKYYSTPDAGVVYSCFWNGVKGMRYCHDEYGMTSDWRKCVDAYVFFGWSNRHHEQFVSMRITR